MKIESNYISIPNKVVNDKRISPTAKLLYGYIRYWDYINYNQITMIEIMDYMNIRSDNTIRKALKELKQVEFIKIDIINKNKRLITPLINDGIMLETSLTAKQENNIEQQKKIEQSKFNEFLKLQEKLEKEEIPEQVKEFFERIK